MSLSFDQTIPVYLTCIALASLSKQPFIPISLSWCLILIISLSQCFISPSLSLSQHLSFSVFLFLPLSGPLSFSLSLLARGAVGIQKQSPNSISNVIDCSSSGSVRLTAYKHQRGRTPVEGSAPNRCTSLLSTASLCSHLGTLLPHQNNVGCQHDKHKPLTFSVR